MAPPSKPVREQSLGVCLPQPAEERGEVAELERRLQQVEARNRQLEADIQVLPPPPFPNLYSLLPCSSQVA